jgi:uroporphyrinogen-III synthase
MKETILVVGASVPSSLRQERASAAIIHQPFIKLEPLAFDDRMREILSKALFAEGIIFTSKHVVSFLKKALVHFHLSLPPLPALCIGSATADEVHKHIAPSVIKMAVISTQEGMIELIRKENFTTLFWPRSSHARPLLSQTFSLLELPLYTPVSQIILPNLEKVTEVFFTSPSSVLAFFEAYPSPPSHIRLSCIGPVTERALQQFLFPIKTEQKIQ